MAYVGILKMTFKHVTLFLRLYLLSSNNWCGQTVSYKLIIDCNKNTISSTAMCQTILIDNVLIRKINSKYPILSQKLNRICSIIEYTNHGLKILDQYNYKQQNSLSFFFWQPCVIMRYGSDRLDGRSVRHHLRALSLQICSKYTETRVHLHKFTTHLLSTVNRSNSITSLSSSAFFCDKTLQQRTRYTDN